MFLEEIDFALTCPSEIYLAILTNFFEMLRRPIIVLMEFAYIRNSWTFQQIYWIPGNLKILTGKTCALLNSVQKLIEMQGWLLLTFFVCLHNQWSFFNSIIVQMSEKRDYWNRHQKWMIASFSNFYRKIWICFCFNIQKRFFLEFSF